MSLPAVVARKAAQRVAREAVLETVVTDRRQEQLRAAVEAADEPVLGQELTQGDLPGFLSDL